METFEIYPILEKVRQQKPLVHHLTNWVTIYDCANITKVLGASPVMAHAEEEVEEMASLASALVLNIGTLTPGFVESMKLAAKAANKKGIPVVLDVCGAGATRLRNDKCFELLDAAKISIIKGNASEIAKIAGENVTTKGVDASEVKQDLYALATKLAKQRNSTVVITGKEDVVADNSVRYGVRNGHELMTNIVGTGCMATSVIGTFAAVEPNAVKASVAGLCCYEIAAELAATNSIPGPNVGSNAGTIEAKDVGLHCSGVGGFKERIFDRLYGLDKETIEKMAKIVR